MKNLAGFCMTDEAKANERWLLGYGVDVMLTANVQRSVQNGSKASEAHQQVSVTGRQSMVPQMQFALPQRQAAGQFNCAKPAH